MSEWINHNSVLVLAVLIVVLIAYAGWNFRQSKLPLVLMAIVLLIGFVGYFQLRTPTIESSSESLVAVVGQGDPIFLEVFSNT